MGRSISAARSRCRRATHSRRSSGASIRSAPRSRRSAIDGRPPRGTVEYAHSGGSLSSRHAATTTAFVTGATEGIGRAIAFALGRAGFAVGVCARTANSGGRARRRAPRRGDRRRGRRRRRGRAGGRDAGGRPRVRGARRDRAPGQQRGRADRSAVRGAHARGLGHHDGHQPAQPLPGDAGRPPRNAPAARGHAGERREPGRPERLRRRHCLHRLQACRARLRPLADARGPEGRHPGDHDMPGLRGYRSAPRPAHAQVRSAAHPPGRTMWRQAVLDAVRLPPRALVSEIDLRPTNP